MGDMIDKARARAVGGYEAQTAIVSPALFARLNAAGWLDEAVPYWPRRRPSWRARTWWMRRTLARFTLWAFLWGLGVGFLFACYVIGQNR